MKYLLVLLMMLSFSVNASRQQTRTYSRCSTKPVSIQTACDLKAYAASPAGTTAYGFFQGYVVGALRTSSAPSTYCSYSSTDQQAVTAAITYLKTITLNQCQTITAAEAIENAFNAGLTRMCY